MASNSNIDIEDATQHLRDILKLDRPGNSDTSSETPKKSTSFNGELNGLMGADLIAGGDRAAMSEMSIHSPEDMNMQEKQTICLSGEDSSTCIIIYARDVEIVASHDSCINSKARGSNKVKIQPVAKYDWEHKYYYGNLIAVSNSYLAYAIRGANSIAMIRVLNVGTAERTLLKGFTGGVTDLAFAHLNSNQLACVDEAGNLFVWQLTEENGKIQTGEEMTKLSLDSSMTLSNSTDMQGSPRNNSILIPGLADQLPFKTVQVIPPANPPLSLDLQSIEPILMPQASPTRERSPDVISSASTAMSQDIPEIASETLQRGLAASGGLPAEVLELPLHSDSMASAASALHLLSPRNRHNSEHSHHSLDMGSGEAERLSSTPSLLETALSQESAAAMAAAATDNSGSQPWPAAPDITRETRNSLIDSDHDDEVASLASSSGNYGSKSTHRLPVEWKSSPRGSPKLKRKSKKEEGVSDRKGLPLQMNTELQEELLSLVRCQQREISELRQSQLELMKRLTNHMDAVQSSIMGHVERVMITQQEQELFVFLDWYSFIERRMERILADGHDRNRQFQEQLSQQLSQSLSNTLSNRLDKTVRDEMKKTVPQYIQQLESHLKNRKMQEHEVRDPMMVQLQQMIDTFQNSTDQLSSNITASVRSEVQHQLHITVGNLQDSILTQVQRIVKGEVSMAMKEQQAAVTTSIMQAMRSAAGTPIPSSHLDYQTQQANILQLLQQGQLNQAFQQALSAADLNLVLYVCETVNSQQVFGQNPCPLIQPVLLSLIQQLSTNLATRTELKIRYDSWVAFISVMWC
ncbi:UNVERIFIED_CONTAM: hypothetical protein FKN15_064362 [Acipenser sinensis]